VGRREGERKREIESGGEIERPDAGAKPENPCPEDVRLIDRQ